MFERLKRLVTTNLGFVVLGLITFITAAGVLIGTFAVIFEWFESFPELLDEFLNEVPEYVLVIIIGAALVWFFRAIGKVVYEDKVKSFLSRLRNRNSQH